MARNTDGESKLTADEKFEVLIAALTQRQEAGITPEVLKELLEAQRKELEPENLRAHPGHSVFSYPEGDLARSRETILTHEFYYNTYPFHKFPETQHYRELELAEQVQPGEYTVIRKDGSRMTVTATGERNADGKLTKVSVTFPVSREDKWLVPPQAVVLYQLVYNDNPRKRFVEAMQEHLNMVLGAPAAV